MLTEDFFKFMEQRERKGGFSAGGDVSVPITDIFLAGDSTMCHYPAENAPREGWGMQLPQYLKTGVILHNLAVSGRSTKSYQDQGYWDNLLSQLKAGDYAVIGMGFNDQAPKDLRPQNHTEPDGEFRENLKRWITQVRGKNAVPVLCTTTVLWKSGGINSIERLKLYNAAIRETGIETDTEVVDLNQAAMDKFAVMPEKEIIRLYMAASGVPGSKDDYCHLQTSGAEFFAGIFVEECKKSANSLSRFFL